MPIEDNKRKGVTKYNKHTGAIYEQLFAFESLKRNLVSHKPILDPTCHDLIVANESGCLTVVQVKSVKYRSYDNSVNKGCFKYTIKATCDNDKTKLSDTYVDVLALYTVNEKVWYIVPTEKIKNKTMSVYPHIEGSQGGYEKFKDCWSFFSDDQVCRS